MATTRQDIGITRVMMHIERNDAGQRPEGEDRRRPAWREFRRSYRGILATLALALAVMIAAAVWLMYKQTAYRREAARLRAEMTEVERQRADLILASDESRMKVMMEMIRRQARGDAELNLAVAVDSGVMYLQREGAILRRASALLGPEKTVGVGEDTVRLAHPRGTRSIERVLGARDAWEVPEWVYHERGLAVPGERDVRGALGPVAVILSGGTVIYSMPTAGPLNDSAYVLPGSVRVPEQDLRAIAPNLKPGQRVYFY